LVAFAKQYGYHDLADIIEGLYFSRLRQSDFFRLTSNSVDLAHGLLQGTQHKTITTSNPSGVPFMVVMPTPLTEIVSRRIQEVKPGSPLFRRYNLQKRFDRVRKVAGLAYVTLQDMRRAAATHLLDNGVDPQTVADSLGHTTLRNLPSYTPRTLRHYREASEKLTISFGEK
jgi:integrase